MNKFAIAPILFFGSLLAGEIALAAAGPTTEGGVFRAGFAEAASVEAIDSDARDPRPAGPDLDRVPGSRSTIAVPRESRYTGPAPG